jgi:CDP-glucose 4,6-dehydratase
MLNLAADKAFHLLGWQSKWGFEQTISETVSWYRAILEKETGAVLNLTREQIASYSGRA